MWLYNDKIIETLDDFPSGLYGFIYMTTHLPSGISYIGKKVLYHNIKRKLTRDNLMFSTIASLVRLRGSAVGTLLIF